MRLMVRRASELHKLESGIPFSCFPHAGVLELGGLLSQVCFACSNLFVIAVVVEIYFLNCTLMAFLCKLQKH